MLASAIAVSGALDAEALCWDVGEIVELRGRTAPTQLARPLNLVSSDDVGENLERRTQLADVTLWRKIGPENRPGVTTATS